jgi:dTMP kinase
MKTIFVTFEGIEGCGKTTQANLLKDNLTAVGIDVVLTREPGGSPISEKIREILLDTNNFVMTPETELLLFSAARHQHTYELINWNLQNGTNVICDRYMDSTLAYQGMARNLDIDFVKRLNEFATSGLKPDITFILDIETEMSFYRMLQREKDRVELESLNFHRAVRKAFLKIAKSDKRYILLDGTRTIVDLQKEIYDIVKQKIKES